MRAIFLSLLALGAACSDGGGAYRTEDVRHELASQSGSYLLRVRSVRPIFEEYPNARFPAVVRVGGGWGGTFLLEHPNGITLLVDELFDDAAGAIHGSSTSTEETEKAASVA